MARNLYRYSGQLRGQNLPEPSKEDLFKAQIFLPALETCREQNLLRFEGHNSIVRKFACLQPKHILMNSCTDLRTAAEELVKIYHKDLQPSLADDLVDLKEDYGSDLKTEGVTISLQLVNFIFERDLPQLVAAMLFIAILVTVASGKRCFSKLKLIKTYLRSTILSQY